MESKGRGRTILDLFKKAPGKIGKLDVTETDANSNQTKELDARVSVTSSRSSIGSFSSDSGEDISGCICNRSLKVITCPKCGAQFEGRVRKQCQHHTKTIHLMDLSYCVSCGANL